jgi:hypothetical protein
MPTSTAITPAMPIQEANPFAISVRCSGSIEGLGPQELGHQVRDLRIVEVREQKVGIAANTEGRQMHELRIASMPVDGVDPEPRHGEPHAPIVLATTLRRFGRNVVTVIDDNRDARELAKVLQRHRLWRQGAGRAWHCGREFTLGEDEAASRLERDDRLDVLSPDPRQPPGPAGLGMGEENARTDAGEQRRHGIGNHCAIVWTGIGRDRAEELVQRLRLLVELDAVEIVRPGSQPELVEEELVIGRRLNGRGNGAIASAAAPRLVDEIDWVASTQKDRLEALASVGRVATMSVFDGKSDVDQGPKSRPLLTSVDPELMIRVLIVGYGAFHTVLELMTSVWRAIASPFVVNEPSGSQGPTSQWCRSPALLASRW